MTKSRKEKKYPTLERERGETNEGTNEEEDDEDGDEPVGEDDAERDADGDPQPEHGLEQEREIVINDRHILSRMRDPNIIPHRRRRRPHDHAYKTPTVDNSHQD